MFGHVFLRTNNIFANVHFVSITDLFFFLNESDFVFSVLREQCWEESVRARKNCLGSFASVLLCTEYTQHTIFRGVATRNAPEKNKFPRQMRKKGGK